MNDSLFALIGLSFFLGCGCWLFFLWGVHKGEFSDLERPKHRMLDEDDAPMPPLAGATSPTREAHEGHDVSRSASNEGVHEKRWRAVPHR